VSADGKIISGSDFCNVLCAHAEKTGKRVFLLGSTVDNNRLSVSILRNRHRIAIGGFAPSFQPYPFDALLNECIRREISVFRPDILMVAFGTPKQEFWIDDNRQFLEELGVKWAIGIGGTLEFVSGNLKRAPLSVQKVGLEGVWRFIREPRRRFWRVAKAFRFLKYI